MQPTSDLLIDRKRLKSQLTSWRALALVAVFGSIAVFFSGNTKLGGTRMGGDYIAEIKIEGMMQDDPKRDALIKEVMQDDHAKAVIVRLDSPGGTTVGGEEIFLQLRDMAKKKPVVGVMHTLCASACYMASLGTDQVFARESTLTGSIGVLLQSVEVSRLAEKLGVTSVTVKSGAYKDVPSLTEPFTEDQRKVLNTLITDAYDHFVAMIVTRRQMDDATVRAIADGRVYTGAQALKLQLIDAIGGNEEALEWLTSKHKINPKLEIRQIEPEEEYGSLLDELTQSAKIKIFGQSAIGLDGLVSIWHPSGL